jgi:hypothetical protein
MLETSPLSEPFDGDPQKYRLGIEAMRLALAFDYDPYFALSIARVDPLPHQLEAVYDYFLRLPRIRFLLADDPGAGKTIMAGLLLKELKIRGLVKRTLIITPASLSFQWQRELKDKFRENFEIIRGDVLSGSYRSFTFNQAMMTADVEISDHMFIITKETAEAFLKTKQQAQGGVEQPAVAGGESTEETQQPSQGPVQTTPGSERAEQLTFASMKWSGEIPPQKWMNFYTKVLSKFAGGKGLALRVEFKVAPDDGVSKQRLDETKAALQGLGFSDDVETS